MGNRGSISVHNLQTGKESVVLFRHICGAKKFILTFSKQLLVDEKLNEIDGIEEYIGVEAGIDFISCAECGEEITNLDAASQWILSRLRKGR